MNHIRKFERFRNSEKIEEGWKENIMAVIIATAGLFSSAKSQASDISKGDTTTTQKSDVSSISVPMGQLFESGKYSLTSLDKDGLKSALTKLGSFIESHKEYNIEVTIESGESQVPNRDGEVSGNPKLEVGALANKRASTAKEVVNIFLQNLNTKNVKITDPKIVIGKTQFNPRVDNKDDDKFKKDQFLNIVIRVVSKSDKSTTSINIPFSAYAINGETIYMNNRLLGIICYPVRSSKNIKDGGMLETDRQDVLFRLVTPNTASTSPNFFSGEAYEIPSDYWNSVSTNKTISQQKLDAFKKAPKEKEARLAYYKNLKD